MKTGTITNGPPALRNGSDALRASSPGTASTAGGRGLIDVVILNDAACIRGGADRIAFDSARGLAMAGHRVLLFTAIGPVVRELQGVTNLTVICLGMTWLRDAQSSVKAAARGIWNRSAARELRAQLALFDPRRTVVHAHLYSSALSAAVLDAAVRAGFPTVLSLHDYFITCPNGAYFEFPGAVPCERRALSGACLACHCDSRRRLHKAWRVARTWVQNRVARLPQRLTAYAAVSRSCAELARRDLPAEARVSVVPNVVAIDRRPPVPAAENCALVFTGRLEAYKGPQLLAEAAAKLDLPAVFCGAGPLEPELRRLNPRARFTGWLTPEGVLAELEKARAFVFPSVFRETFGLSAAEALARGLPVVASRGTAAGEFMRHGRNGLLFEHNSVDSLANQLAVLTSDAVVGELGANAYADYWAAPFTLENHLAHLRAFYASVLPAESDGAVKPAVRGRSEIS